MPILWVVGQRLLDHIGDLPTRSARRNACRETIERIVFHDVRDARNKSHAIALIDGTLTSATLMQVVATYEIGARFRGISCADDQQ